MSHPQAPTRITFSLRFLFTVSAVCGMGTYLVRYVGWVEALGTMGAIFGFWAIAMLKQSPSLRFYRWLLGLPALGVWWFVALDYSCFYEYCEYCKRRGFVFEHRIYKVSLTREERDWHSELLNKIARDLGASCPHHYSRTHLTREWGLFYCARPCTSIMCCLGVMDQYDEEWGIKVKNVAKKNPRLAKEFRSALVRQDKKYLQEFVKNIRYNDLEND